ncbi:MAG TPA: DUF2191 domain-containing protein [Chloroflexota bacterium]|jgi:hypothetical protein
MKTTVEIANALLAEAKEIASQERTSMRALIEEGLRRVLEDRQRERSFHLRRASFRGSGLQAEFADGSWDRIRDRVYEGRGS